MNISLRETVIQREIKHIIEIVHSRFIRHKLLELEERRVVSTIFTHILCINLITMQRDVLTMRFPSREPKYATG